MSSAPEAPVPNRPRRRNKLPLILVGVLVLVALIAGGIVLVAGGDDDDGSDDVAAESDQAGDSDGSDGSDDSDSGDSDDSGNGDGNSNNNSGGSGDAEDVEAAEAVVRNYFDAVLDQDCQAMFDAVTESTWSASADDEDEAIEQCEASVEAGELDFDGEASLDELTLVDQSDDSVTLEATETIDGEVLREEFLVVDEDGEWRIDLSDT
jgi:hypothetical protein